MLVACVQWLKNTYIVEHRIRAGRISIEPSQATASKHWSPHSFRINMYPRFIMLCVDRERRVTTAHCFLTVFVVDMIISYRHSSLLLFNTSYLQEVLRCCLEWPCLKCWLSPAVGASIEVVFVLFGKRILDGKPGVQGEAASPLLAFHRAERNKTVIFYLYATNTSE